MKKVLLQLLFITAFINIKAYSQTTAAYFFSAFSSTYSSIASTGTVMGSTWFGDDRTQTSVPIGFTFNYCLTNYTTMSVCSNGWTSFTNSTVTTFTNFAAGISGAGWLMPYWNDLITHSPGGYYQTVGTAPNRIFTMEWKDVTLYSNFGTSPAGSFQMKLYETSNVIDYCYGPVSYTTGGTSAGAATIGISNSTTDYRTLPNFGTSPTPNTTFNDIANSPVADQVYRWSPCPVLVTATASAGVCPGGTVTLTGTTTGSGWSWSGPSGFTSTLLSPVLTGVTSTSAGSYVLTATNGTCTMSATTVVTVNAVPATPTITPSTTSMCNGGVLAISSSAAATWSATTDLFLDAGYTTPYTGSTVSTVYLHPTTVSTSTVRTYTATVTNGFGCTSSATSTVTINPAVAPITGALLVCAGYTTTLSDPTPGGTWSSGTPTMATVGSLTGIVTAGGTPGTATIFYTVAGCSSVATVTITPTPTAITGLSIVCIGATITLTNGLSGGTWSSSNTAVGTVGATTGIVEGISVGTTTITYDMGSGCYVTKLVSVNPYPGAIAGSASVCIGATTTLTSSPSGGIWTATSTPPGVATVGALTGVVSGLALGVSTIRYQVAGCAVTMNVTVVSSSTPPAGPDNICVGSDATYTTGTPGGTWASSPTAIGTIGSLTGILTGISVGTTTITYALSAGCTSTKTVTVTPAPSAIIGASTVCEGLTTPLSHTTPGGTWISSTPAIGTVGIATGLVGGVSATPAPGTTTITYTTPAACFVTKVMTVLPLPSAITGTMSLCQSATATLSSATPGGTWLSGNPSVATIVSGSGLWTAVSVGTSTITYTASTGCIITAVVSVNGIPLPITGPGTVCAGQTITLADATPGGGWSSSTPLVATVSGIGDVTGVATSGGTTTITYTLPSGCYVTKIVTVNANSAPILGTLGLCVGFTTSLTCATPGGWSSSNPLIASILSPGLIGGVSAGTATITCPSAGSCPSTVVVTVNALPGAIGGTLSVCAGQTTTLTNSASGGVWTSVSTAVGTIDAGTGVLTGVATGTTTISYSLGSGCSVFAVATVNALPAAIGTTLSTCQGTPVTLTSAPSGGTWFSDATTIASIGVVTGTVTPGLAGTANITYTATTGCRATAVFTVNTLPAAITGLPSVCVGQTTTLSSATPGGVWSSSNTFVAPVSVSGVVTGNNAGTTTIIYTVGGCSRSIMVNVNPLPTGISGPIQVCVGSTTTITGSPSGVGTWSSSTAATGTITAGSGILTGMGAGTTTITYTLGTGCYLTAPATVNALPGTITGVPTTCVGQTTTLSCTPATGTWSLSAGTGTAIIGSGTGVLTGGTAGTVSVTYTLPTGCKTMATVTVFALPGIVSGSANVCVGSTTTLSCAPIGGTWTTSAIGIASVGVTTGIVTGVSTTPPGTATITYTLGTGCISTRSVTVNPLPNPLTGSLTTCVGQTTTLSSTSTPGTWLSGNTAVATVSGTGVVTGVSGGSGSATSTITYTIGTGCQTTAEVTVYALPSPIGGSLQVCENNTTTLTTTTPGGTWSSSNPAAGTIDATTGILGGILAGTTNITYSLGTGCYKTAVATVNAVPAPITGILQVCEGATTTLSNATTPGVWSSGATGTATVVSGTGVVTGVLSGTATISYTIGTGCRSTTEVTVHAQPSVITGPSPMAVCENATVTLSSTPPGGIWTSASPSNATINPVTGDVTGVAAGTATISYTVGIGCVRTTTVVVNPQPNAITGNLNVCIGLTQLLSTTSTGGTWSSSNTTTAPVDPTGLVSGLALGTANISYTLPITSCSRSVQATVQPLPSTITGSSGFCNLSSTTYLSSPGGGTWTSSNIAVLTIDPSSGLATGVSVDTAIITYTLPTGCIATKSVFLILAPYPITGPSDMCLGQTRTLGNTITGGVWSSSNPLICSIDASTGVATGHIIGVATITYVLSSGCFSTLDVTVNPIPSGVSGPTQVCVDYPATYSCGTPGGTWSSSNPAVGSIDVLSGVLSPLTSGILTVTYTLGSGCNAMLTVTVNDLPDPITGIFQVCEGSSTTLFTTSTGGLWQSADPAVADVDALTGVVTGYSALTPGVGGIGQTSITYTLPTGCYREESVTVNPLPSSISGPTDVCLNDVVVFTNPTPGGGWTSSNPVVGTIDGLSGIFTALSPGFTIVKYSLATGCDAGYPVQVHDNPTPIGGSLSVCAGFSTNLTSGPPGGVWSQDPLSMVYGTIHPITGVVSGITTGLIPVTYTMGSGCKAIENVTVITLPAVISGPPQVCVDDSVILTNPVAGGTWSSSNPMRATIDPVIGRVHGISAGTVVMTYAVGTGCFNVLTMTVNALPLPITGPLQVCEGSAIILSSGPTPGGNWITDNTSVANVGFFSGIVSGVSPGVANISYSIGLTGCLRSVPVTVNATPGPIVGNPHVCMGSSNIFTDTLAGGIWISSNPAIATIGATTGIVTSVSVGTVIITYQYAATGCQATRIISVQPLPIVYNVTGGGAYCATGNGVHIGLDGSQPGVSYVLYRSATAVGYMPGSGFALDFGLLTAAGAYTAQATNVTSGCMKNMAGSATVVVNPLLTPSVTIATTPSDTVCPGQTISMMPLPVNGGTAPTYIWKVNGVSVTTATTYSYIPANGDIVTVTMGSNANCLAALTATGAKTLTVLPNVMPVANVLTTPNDTICQFNPVTFTAAPVYGGYSPTYTWLLNGSTAGTGSSYTYIPVDGDIVNLKMVSDYRCRLATTVTSGDVALSVDSLLIPNVTVWPEPGLAVEAGKPITLHATATNAGASPTFQWKVNGHPVAGATNGIYTAIFHDYDSISCMVISSGVCNNIGTFDWVFITTVPLGATGTQPGTISDLRLVPNPNKGVFTIKGSLGGSTDETVNADVTNMLGQVVYRGELKSKEGRLDAQVQLDSHLANGMYILTLRTDTEQKVFHFVMEQ